MATNHGVGGSNPSLLTYLYILQKSLVEAHVWHFQPLGFVPHIVLDLLCMRAKQVLRPTSCRQRITKGNSYCCQRLQGRRVQEGDRETKHLESGRLESGFS